MCLLALALATSLPASHAGGQTVCTRTGDAAGSAVTVTCSGNQSGGIDNSDILGATSQGGAPAVFPGTGTPPNAAQDITVRVRELTVDPAPPVVTPVGIDLWLGGGTGEIPAPIRSSSELGTFTLDVDLGPLRIAPGTTMQDLAVTAIRLDGDASAVRLATDDAVRTSLIARLRGDFRTTGVNNSAIAIDNIRSSTGTVQTEGNVDVTIRENSRIQAVLGDSEPAVRAFANRGDATITLESGVSLIGTTTGVPRGESTWGVAALTEINPVTGVPLTAEIVPGNPTVTVAGGTATDGMGNRIPNIQIDSIGSIGVVARATNGNFSPNFLDPGAVTVTTEEGSSILTTEDSSLGIFADSIGKNITVSVAGEVETESGASADPNFRTALGLVDSLGILARTERAPEVLVTVQSTGSVVTAGERADAIRLITRGQPVAQNPGASPPGPSTLRAVVAGTVRTAGRAAAALRASADDDDPMTTAVGDIALRVAAGATIETQGMAAHGIIAETESGVVEITTAGAIETRGPSGNAIVAFSRDGDPAAEWGVDVEVAGSVTTRAINGHGVRAFVGGADNDARVRVRASGGIETGAPGAAGGRGIFVSGQPAANQRSDLRIEIDGPVTSYNDNAAVWAHTATQLVPGTMQRVAGTVGDVTVLTTAPVAGHLDGTDGIDAETGDGVVTVRTAGSVTTRGAGGHAIFAVSRDGDPADEWGVDVEVAGAVTTRGDDSHGVRAIVRGADNDARVRVRASGGIETGAPGAAGGRGIFVSGQPAANQRSDLQIEIDGPVTSYNDNAAVWAHTATQLVPGTMQRVAGTVGDVTVLTTAPVAGHLDGTDGIDAETGDGVVTVRTAGSVTTRGAGGHAIFAVSRDGDPADEWGVDVEVAGAVTTRGDDSHGVRAIVRGADNDARVRVRASGAIETGAPGAAGGRGIFVSGQPAAGERSDLQIEIDGPVTSYNDNAAVWAHTATQLVPGTMQRVLGTVGDVTVLTTAPVTGHLDGTDGIDAETGDGVVTVRTGSSVTTRGAGGNAIRAVTGNGTVAITVGGGRVFAAAAAATRAAAVRAQAPLGTAQRLLLTVARDGAVEGETAVAFAGGSDAAANPNRILVQSGGSLIGALALGAGADLLENRGLLALRGSSQFGAGVGVDRFLQAGQFEPGGAGRVETVSLWGLETVEFAPGGVLVIDVDGMGAGARADRIVFGAETSGGTGPPVTLGGVVQIREMPGRMSFRTGETSFPILGTDGGLSGVGNLRLSVTSTGEVVQPLSVTSTGGVIRRLYRLVGEDGGTELRLVQVTGGSFVCPDGDRNIRAVGAELDRLASLAELPEEFESLLSGLGDLPKGGPYERAVNLLHAEPYDALLQGSWHAERALVDALWEGCGGAPGEGGYCAFGGLHGRSLDRVGEAANADFEELALGPRGGVSRHLGELGGRSWQLRVGAAYEALDLEWREGARGRGDRLLGGVALHSRSPGGAGPGPFLGGLDVGLALAGGGAWFETERVVDRLGIAHAEAEPELTFLGGHGRLLYRLGRAPQELGWYAEFGLEGSAVALWLESFSEEKETAGVLRLRVAEARELVTTVRPQLGLGGSWQWGELRVAPRARLGFSYAVGGADTPYRARWIEAPSPPGRGFTTWGDREDWLIEASGGLAVTLREQISLRLDYTGRISPDGTTRSHEGQLRAELRF